MGAAEIGRPLSPFAARVYNSRSLDELLAVLRAAPAEPSQEDERVWTSCPTFGGTEPRDTSGVWSWDATRLNASGVLTKQ